MLELQPAGASGPPAGTGVYLFCFTHPTARVSEEFGLDARYPLASWALRDVAAVYSAVDLDDFCGPGADERLQDLAWVGPRACRHQEVVARLMQEAPVLPVRFGTLFSSLEPLRRLTAEHSSVITGFLDHATDKEEWAVKGWVDAARFETWLLAADETFAERVRKLPQAAGVRYLQEKKLRADVQRQLRFWGREVAGKIHALLAPEATEAHFSRVQGRGEDGREAVLNASYFLPRAAVGAFRGLVAELASAHAAQGLTLETSGPWPPFSFSPTLRLHSPEVS